MVIAEKNVADAQVAEAASQTARTARFHHSIRLAPLGPFMRFEFRNFDLPLLWLLQIVFLGVPSPHRCDRIPR